MIAVMFFVVAALVLGGALGVVLSPNPVYSALFLVATLIGIAAFFLMENAQLLAAVQIIVYASAVVVLFLFVIMLLGVDRYEGLGDPRPLQRPVAVVVGIILVLEIALLAGHNWATGTKSQVGKLHGANIQSVARALFTTYLWPFEITAILFVAAVVGAVVLARRSGRGAPVESSSAEVGS
ncbi:MAG: NADH:ubiquinone oxidoreductase subunit 6 [Actinomycetia bacterium]|nr:NADH:ubiquinone oxidoreductase subunit 6 [Actinomycetes bacterium]